MGHSKRMRMGDKRSFLSLFIVFCLLFSLLSTALAKPAEAKSTRAAIVIEANGDVSVKKAGGSKSYTAYQDMSLNQGDVIITGDSSSAVLKIADHDDEITIGDNAEVSITGLSNQGNGKSSKLKSFAGSMWVKVKSLVSSEDEFEVETPTAVMGVRGTQFLTGVNAETGDTYVTVGAGAVLTTSVGKERKDTLLLPSQQISLSSRDEVNNLNTKVAIIDIYKLVEKASPRLIEAIIRNKADIDKENKEFIEKKKQEIAEKNAAETGNSSLSIKDIETLNKLSKNLDNIVGNIAKVALEQKKFEPGRLNQIIAETNNQIEDPASKLDLNKVEELDVTAGADPELEKEKQADLERLNAEKQRQLAERLKLEQELLQRFKETLDSIEKEKNRVEEENKKVTEAANKKAEEEYSKQLSDDEKKRFEADKNRAENPTPAPTPSNNNDVVIAPALTKLPDILLTEERKDSNSVKLNLSMVNFPLEKEFYAVEAHLVYDNSLSYNGTIELQDIPNTVFDGQEKSAETLRQVSGATQNELIYAASQFEAAGATGTVSNITVDGKKVLVSIPLNFSATAANTIKVDLVYVKVVNKNGDTVAEFTNSKSLTVTK